MNLENVTTKELVEELEKREWVRTLTVAKYERFHVSTMKEFLDDDGPVKILVIQE